ncbi:LysR family transcriptional regulator [Enterobacter sp.]|uniref:LysR family transcriptional regulator n=1 Tax=Enterobacter sp. TaxID=42895 RepID=UPI00296FD58D|nr:LysR family transcriptional regulator [Enterobacter sp.]
MTVDKILAQFIEVALLKNVSHAAKKLHLSQPTLTQNMKKLEARLGIPLFERTASGVTTTEYGDLLLEQAQMMQRIYSNTLIKLESFKERQTHNLRIGTGHAWWHLFVSDCFNRYRMLHPEVNIHIDLGNHLRLIDLLLSGDIDLFIGHEIHGLNPRVGIHFHPLFTVTDSMFARDGHPLCGHKVTPEALLDFPHLKLTPDEKRYRQIVEDVQQQKLSRNRLHLTEQVVWSTNSLVSAIDMLNHSDAVLQSYPACMADYFAAHHIVPLKGTQQGQKNIVGVYILREKIDAPHVIQVQKMMLQQLENKNII